MNTYQIDIFEAGARRVGHCERIVLQRHCIQSEDFSNAIADVFFFVCTCAEQIEATIRRNEEEIFRIRGTYDVDGSTVLSRIQIARPREKYRTIRVMEVAS